MPRSQKEIPWICPECGYAPRAHQVRNNGPYMYDVRDAVRMCPRRPSSSDAGSAPACPQIAQIGDRILRFR